MKKEKQRGVDEGNFLIFPWGGTSGLLKEQSTKSQIWKYRIVFQFLKFTLTKVFFA